MNTFEVGNTVRLIDVPVTLRCFGKVAKVKGDKCVVEVRVEIPCENILPPAPTKYKANEWVRLKGLEGITAVLNGRVGRISGVGSTLEGEGIYNVVTSSPITLERNVLRRLGDSNLEPSDEPWEEPREPWDLQE